MGKTEARTRWTEAPCEARAIVTKPSNRFDDPMLGSRAGTMRSRAEAGAASSRGRAAMHGSEPFPVAL
jgi:hypothetical protein